MSDGKKLAAGFLILISFVLLLVGIINKVIGMIILGSILTAGLTYSLVNRNKNKGSDDEDERTN